MRLIFTDDNSTELDSAAAIGRKLSPGSRVDAYQDAAQAIAAMDEERVDVAVLDIAMPDMDGIELAMELRSRYPDVNIIFATAHSRFAPEAFRLRASGYLVKPVLEADLRRELDNLRNPVIEARPEKPFLRAFGNFEVFFRGEPVVFRRPKSKEILAYLTDRKGAAVTTRELASILWEDREFDLKLSKNLSNYIAELVNDLNAAGLGNILGKRRGELYLYTDAVDCDYYRYLDGDEQAVNSFKDEYMTQYPWGEFTLGSLVDY